MSDWQDDYMSDADRAYMERMEAIEGYCDLCETSGHTVRSCPGRDDEYEDQYEDMYGEIREDDIDYDDSEIEAAKGRHPSTFDPDEDAAIIRMEDSYEKYLDRMKEHGP